MANRPSLPTPANGAAQELVLTRHQLKPKTDDPEWEKEKADLKKDVNKAADKAEKHGKEFKKKAKVSIKELLTRRRMVADSIGRD